MFRLLIGSIEIDLNPFLINILELQNPKILIRSSQAKSTKGKNVIIISEERHELLKEKKQELLENTSTLVGKTKVPGLQKSA